MNQTRALRLLLLSHWSLRSRCWVTWSCVQYYGKKELQALNVRFISCLISGEDRSPPSLSLTPSVPICSPSPPDILSGQPCYGRFADLQNLFDFLFFLNVLLQKVSQFLHLNNNLGLLYLMNTTQKVIMCLHVLSCVLLFTLYTQDYSIAHHPNTIFTSTDDSVVLGLISGKSESVYRD